MKRVSPTYTIIFLLISFIFISENISAQIDLKDESSHIKDSVLYSTQTVYWFVWKIKQNERTNPPYISRLPIATASGSFNDFKVFLEENLLMRILTIGPFKTEEEAELAKRMYRLNENY